MGVSYMCYVKRKENEMRMDAEELEILYFIAEKVKDLMIALGNDPLRDIFTDDEREKMRGICSHLHGKLIYR